MIKLLLSILFIIFSSNSKSENLTTSDLNFKNNSLDPYKIEFVVSSYNLEKKTFLAGIFVELKKDWKIYWENPGMAGLPPKLNWNEVSNINNGSLLFPAPKKFEFFDIKTFGYKNKVIFPIEIQILDEKKSIKGLLKFDAQVCNEICIPVEKEFYIEFSTKTKFDSTKKNEIKKFLETVPVKRDFVNKAILKDKKLIIELKNDFSLTKETLIVIENKSFQIFPKTELDFKNDKVFINSYLNKLDDKILKSNKYKLSIFSKKLNVYQNFTVSNKDIYEYNLINIIVISFLAGFVLNFMPCVLPVLSLKLTSLVSLIQNKTSYIRKSIFFQVLGIFSSFLLLSLFTIFLKFAGYQIGWGFQFQNQYFLIFLTILVFAFGLNILGVFQIRLPGTVLFYINKFSVNNFRDFSSGFLMTLLATPCTAPFVGTAVSFALSGDYYDIFLVFQIMSLGLSFPLLLFFFFPQLIKIFPKSGNWLNIFKKLMATLFLLTGIWLLSILLQNYNFDKFNSKNNDKVNWIKWDINKQPNLIKELLSKDKIIFLDITAEWCITCKYNKLFVIDNESIVKIFNDMEVIPLQLDWTKKNYKIEKFLFSKERYGIPYNEFYSEKYRNGYLLPELLNEKVLINAINKIKN